MGLQGMSPPKKSPAAVGTFFVDLYGDIYMMRQNGTIEERERESYQPHDDLGSSRHKGCLENNFHPQIDASSRAFGLDYLEARPLCAIC